MIGLQLFVRKYFGLLTNGTYALFLIAVIICLKTEHYSGIFFSSILVFAVSAFLLLIDAKGHKVVRGRNARTKMSPAS